MPDDQPDLFPEAKQLSPKLIWMAKHGLETWRVPYQDPDEFPGIEWCCSYWTIWAGGDCHERNTGLGATEDEAILAFCALAGIAHWTVEDHARLTQTHALPER